jgi:hypothetical protein
MPIGYIIIYYNTATAAQNEREGKRVEEEM